MLEAGEAVGQGAHVAAALHIVLAPQRVEAAGIAADMAGEQGQVDQRGDIVDAIVVSPGNGRESCWKNPAPIMSTIPPWWCWTHGKVVRELFA